MKAKNYIIAKKAVGGILIFTTGGISGYFLKNNELSNSEANSTYHIVCHQETGNKSRTLVVTGAALQGHLNHGDQLGTCITATLPDETKLR